jgi:hypothetical protein
MAGFGWIRFDQVGPSFAKSALEGKLSPTSHRESPGKDFRRQYWIGFFHGLIFLF